MNISLKSPPEIEIMREGGKILNNVLNTVANAARPGISTNELDQLGEKMILEAKAYPSFKGYQGFPNALCTSVNEEVVHGIPSGRILKSGDIFSVDGGVFHKGFHTDKALSVIVGQGSPEKERLLTITREALELAQSKLRAGVLLGEISHSIQTFVEQAGFHVIRDLVGHGIGRELHEDPPVPNFGPAKMGPVLEAGMTIAIEPMVAIGTHQVSIRDWEVKTVDNSLSAHFENTFLITENGSEVLT